MKCYAIKSGDEYIADVSRAISESWYKGLQFNTTDDVDSAKHYKAKSAPRNWIRKNAEKYLQMHEYQLKRSTNSSVREWDQDRAEKLARTSKIIHEWVKDAVVEELDLEEPNFKSDSKVMWNTNYRYHKDSDHQSKMKLETVRHSRFTCKACQVKLKNVPFYVLYDCNNLRICVPCMYIRMDAIKNSFESMDEKQRTTIVNELMLGAL